MFEHHLFINYAHRDNTHLDHLTQGWIDLLHERLENRLGQLLGEKPDIWRDPKLRGYDHFDQKISIILSPSALFVGILTPSYIKSEWCSRELQEFHDQAVANGGVHIEDKSRIFKVLKTPVTSDEQPQRMCGVLGYEFFGIDPATGRFREFNHGTGANHDPRYWNKLEDLAQDIKELIKCLGNPQPPAALIQISSCS